MLEPIQNIRELVLASEQENFFHDFDLKLAEAHEQLQEANLPALDLFPQSWKDNYQLSKVAFIDFLTKIKRKKAIPDLYIPQENLLISNAITGEHYNLDDRRGQVCKVSQSYSREEIQFHLLRLRTVFDLYKEGQLDIRLDYSDYFNKNLQLHLEFIRSVIESNNRNLTEVAEMNAGKHYLSHGVPPAFLPQMLVEGKLSSKKSQRMRKGFSNDNTPIPGYTDSEASEVCFAEDHLYGDIGVIYFIFPTGYLLQGGQQFYNHDGLHVFDQRYSETNPCGFEVNLSTTPHFMVARERDREYVHSVLSNLYDDDELVEEKFAEILFIGVERISEVFDGDATSLFSSVGAEAEHRFANVQIHLGQHIIPTSNNLASGEGRWSNQKNLYSFAG